jgi:Rieske Fe-S protein
MADERFPRKRLFERATLGLGAFVALGAGVPAAAFALLPTLRTVRTPPVDLGPVDAFPEGRFVVATFLSDPGEGTLSRRAAFVRNNGSVDGVPSFTILSSRCTHVGCPTQPNGPVLPKLRASTADVGLAPTIAAGFGCPCHGSQFDTEGNRTAGPAPRALDRYAFSIVDGRLHLEQQYSVSRVEGSGSTARIHRFRRQDAGQPLDGAEAWLYPVQPPH